MRNVKDKNGKIIKEGHFVKFGYLYWAEGSSEDWFGTEPQNSYHVIEIYTEYRKSKVYLRMGALSIKIGKKMVSIKEHLENAENRLDDVRNLHEDEYDELLLTHNNYEKKATRNQVIKFLKTFEIIPKKYLNNQ